MKYLLYCILAFLLGSGWAGAEMPALSQAFEDYMLAHHYAAVKLESQGTNKQSVDAYVNGRKVTLMVDTGSPITCLSYQCARSLGLDIHDLKHEIWGIGGAVDGTYGIALIQSFKLRFGEINHTNTLVILPRDTVIDSSVDGIFGADFLGLNAAVFPIGGHGILLKPGPLPAVSLAGYMTKLNFKPVPLNEGHGSVWVTAYLNGKPLDLKIDSGAVWSNFRAAKVKTDLGAKELDSVQSFFSQGLDGKRITNFYFEPERLSLGDFDVSHQSLLASDAPSFDKFKFDGLAGFDLLGKHDAVIDFGNLILWMR